MTISDTNQLQALLESIVPDMPDVEALVRNEDGCWFVGFEDDLLLMLDWADEPARLMLTAEVGTPPPERELEVLRTMLSFCLLPERSPGIKFGMGGEEDRSLVVIRECAAGQLGPDLQNDLRGFAELARWWAEFVTNGSDAPPPGLGELHFQGNALKI